MSFSRHPHQLSHPPELLSYGHSGVFPPWLVFNPLNVELNPICHLLALLGAHHIFHVSGLRVN